MEPKQYPKYRDSGIQWIGKIPEDWDVFRFKIKFRYSKGRIPIILEETNGEGYSPYLSMEYLRGKEDAQILYSPKDPSSTSVKNGELLLLWDGSNAGEFVIGKEGYLSSTMVKLSPQGIKKEYSKYLCFAFEGILRDLTIGMGIPHVNSDHLDNIRVAIPSDKEQENISKFLDKKVYEINDLINKDKQLIELIKERKIAMIDHFVSKGYNKNSNLKSIKSQWMDQIPNNWKIWKLGHLARLYSGGTPDRSNESYWDNGEIPWVSSGEVNQIDITQPTTFISKEGYVNSSAKWIPKDSLVIALAGQGKTKGMVAYLRIKTTGNQSLGVIVPLKVNSRYLFYWLKRNYLNIRGMAGEGIRDGLSLDMLKEIRVPLPPKSEQIQIADFLDKATAKIDLTISKIESKIELLEEYKKSIIHHVVTGKVDVK
jgi:type I restriction enzyme S subunit